MIAMLSLSQYQLRSASVTSVFVESFAFNNDCCVSMCMKKTRSEMSHTPCYVHAERLQCCLGDVKHTNDTSVSAFIPS